jgi:hypothetical protein
MAKKIRVHWVQRQDLRTVTKEPITGLCREFWLVLGLREKWKGKGDGLP